MKSQFFIFSVEHHPHLFCVPHLNQGPEDLVQVLAHCIPLG
jgi:hypothetical protein